jgi:hypothetical protein
MRALWCGWFRCLPAARRQGALLLVALVLAAPVMVAANPVDQIWIPGLYDDADTDQLVTQAMSPESWLGAAIPILPCVLSSTATAWSSRSECRVADRRAPGARAPPLLRATPVRLFPLDARHTQSARLALLTLRRSSFLPCVLRSSSRPPHPPSRPLPNTSARRSSPRRAPSKASASTSPCSPT